MQLWGVDIWWYSLALLGPLAGVLLSGAWGTGCSACVAGYCKEHENRD